MELPAPILIHNELLGLKGAHGTLLQVNRSGFYIVTTSFGDKRHKVLLPVDQTVVIFEEPEESVEGVAIEVER